jgi:hypothetical protein
MGNTDKVDALLDQNKITNARMLSYGLGTIGTVAGIVVAVKRKSGIWGCIGWAFLGSMAGGGIASVINSAQGGFFKK